MAVKEWLKAICPICNQEFSYLSDYKPKTCGKFSCIQEAVKRGIIK